jgi:hypothetical protein
MPLIIIIITFFFPLALHTWQRCCNKHHQFNKRFLKSESLQKAWHDAIQKHTNTISVQSCKRAFVLKKFDRKPEHSFEYTCLFFEVPLYH